jgi:protein-S-isoprenylcysteine O-methyltransferase Ste14
MPRWTVPGLFAALAILAGARAIHALGDAVGNPTARAGLIALYFLLRAGVTSAFAAFTLRRPAPHRVSRDPAAFAACAMAMLLVMPFAGPSSDTATALVLAGDLIAVAACGWLLASILALRSCFGVLPEARGLVVHGPYRLVRHPLYLGEIVAVAGLTLSSPAVWSIALIGPFAVAQWVRMGLEENALAAAFPEYRAYAARTGRLLPRIRGYRKLMGRRKNAAAAITASVIAAIIAGGCGATQGSHTVHLQVNAPTSGSEIAVADVNVYGTVDPASAAVVVAGTRAQVAHGTFTRRMVLGRGLSHIKVVATAPGYAPAQLDIAVRSSLCAVGPNQREGCKRSRQRAG